MPYSFFLFSDACCRKLSFTNDCRSIEIRRETIRGKVCKEVGKLCFSPSFFFINIPSTFFPHEMQNSTACCPSHFPCPMHASISCYLHVLTTKLSTNSNAKNVFQTHFYCDISDESRSPL